MKPKKKKSRRANAPRLYKFKVRLKGWASGLVWAKDEAEATFKVSSQDVQLDGLDRYEVSSVSIGKRVA